MAEDDKQPVNKHPAIDGITHDGVNNFTTASYGGLALAVKPELTDGEFNKWISGVNFANAVAVYRSSLLDAARKAGIITHLTDNGSGDIPARRVQWYGEMLRRVYNDYTFIDPN